jgi:hypothetical protein
MIYFFADSHYGVNPGKHIFESLGKSLKKRIVFTEDSWELLEAVAGLMNVNCLF